MWGQMWGPIAAIAATIMHKSRTAAVNDEPNGARIADIRLPLLEALAPVATPKRKRCGEFDWRREEPTALRRRNYLSIEAFVRHLQGLDLGEGITWAHLITLYVEWIDAHQARPIDGWNRFARELRACGVTKRRSSLPGRPRLYYAPDIVPAAVINHPPNRIAARAQTCNA